MSTALYPKRPQRSRTAAQQRAHLAREIVEVVVLLAIIFFVTRAVIDARSISDATMAPQFSANQWILVNKAAYAFGSPSRGEVVLVANPQDPKAPPLLRRVIGIPGDTVVIAPSSVTVDDVVLNEPYAQKSAGGTENSTIGTYTLGPDQYFVLCDNRVSFDAVDSRGFGTVPLRNIVGKAVAVYWPLSAFKWVNTYSDTFSGIH